MAYMNKFTQSDDYRRDELIIFMMAITPAFAQEENGFKKFNVREDFTENGFQWFHDAELLCAGDKAQALGLHTAYTANGTPYFKSDAPKKMYANFPAGIHSMYIGEVINAWKK